MPKIEAWECPTTGNLFKHKEDYRRHMAKLAAARRFAANRKIMLAQAEVCVKELHQQKSFADICRWIEKNYRLLYERQIIIGNFSNRRNVMPSDFFVKDVAFENMVWSDMCSNSHSAPAGKKTNWCGSRSGDGVPRGYPGYTGSISFTTSQYGYCDLFKNTGIHTGSGGGSEKKFRFDVTLFAEEWPMLVMHDDKMWHHATKQSSLSIYEDEID